MNYSVLRKELSKESGYDKRGCLVYSDAFIMK